MINSTFRTIQLEGPTDLAGFRLAVKKLLIEQISPESVNWLSTAASYDLFDDHSIMPLVSSDDLLATHATKKSTPLLVSAQFMALCQLVILHRDLNRFGLMYRFIWRLQQQANLRNDLLDKDRIELESMAAQVRRDLHKMKAFVRFRKITNHTSSHFNITESNLYVAWFEPAHHIVKTVASFFQQRFTQMHWVIFTPDDSVYWDGQRLEFGSGVQRDQVPSADEGEKLWLTYYAHIFNPARLKIKAMQKEMPRRYWHNLPEASLITSLTTEARQRSMKMIEQAPTTPVHRLPRAVYMQKALISNSRTGLTDKDLSTDLAQLNWQDLHQAANQCRACPIGFHATQVVFGEGPLQARLMIVAEQPGDQEDLIGRPFVGPAGQLFERALEKLQWNREAFYLTNAVKHFKFEARGKQRLHRTPTQSEISICSQWLEREIQWIKPQAFIALGATAARALLDQSVAIMQQRGKWLSRIKDNRPVLITLHPSALLRQHALSNETHFTQWVNDLALAQPFIASTQTS